MATFIQGNSLFSILTINFSLSLTLISFLFFFIAFSCSFYNLISDVWRSLAARQTTGRQVTDK
jgi:hypothetical protein